MPAPVVESPTASQAARRASPLDWLHLTRPTDWLKNLLVLAALVFGSRLTLWRDFCAAAVAAMAFTLVSAGFYAINDSLDAQSDRAHPLKRHRPVANGAIAASAAMVFGIVLIAAGLAVGFVLSNKVGLVLILYALLQIIYNAGLKRVALYDVAALAVGFVLRAAAGAAAIHAHISVWFILGVYFLCIYLGFIKRMADLVTAVNNGAANWHSPAGYDDLTELNWNAAVSGALAVGTYLSYTLSNHAQVIFGYKALLFALLAPLVILAMQRLYRRARQGSSDRPLDAFTQDAGFRTSVLLYVVITILLLYESHVGPWLSKYLLN
jgi:decaprenyl-phosphate phosphoribosyltransferase